MILLLFETLILLVFRLSLNYSNLVDNAFNKFLNQSLHSMLSLPFFLFLMTGIASILTMNTLKCVREPTLLFDLKQNNLNYHNQTFSKKHPNSFNVEVSCNFGFLITEGKVLLKSIFSCSKFIISFSEFFFR